MYSVHVKIKEPVHDKNSKITCAPREDSDQTGHSLRCPHEEALCPRLSIMRLADLVDAQADLSLRWVHRSFCCLCHAAAH